MSLCFQACFFSSQVLVDHVLAVQGTRVAGQHENYFDAISSARTLLCLHHCELKTNLGQTGDGQK